MAITTRPWRELHTEARSALAVDATEPRLHARPATAELLAETLRHANQEGLAVVPRGGGTHLSLGNRPPRVDLLLETTGLDRVIQYEPADLTVTIEAGLRLSALQALLGAQGQFLALDPPTHEDATVGGVIAANLSGPSRFAYGTARDLVIGTRVANPDGTLTRAGGRVVKNVAGYDLSKLHVGALGTLGILVELSFKLHGRPPVEAVATATFGTAEAAQQALASATLSRLAPRAIELLGSRAARHLGLGTGHALVLRFAGYAGAVARQMVDARTLLREHGGAALDDGAVAWEQVRGLWRDAPGEVLIKAAAPPAASALLVSLLESQLAMYSPTVWAHAGNGIVYAALGAPADAQPLSALRDAVRALGDNASLVIQRCPTGLKDQIDAWGERGPADRLMLQIKRALDPRDTLNPGRFSFDPPDRPSVRA